MFNTHTYTYTYTSPPPPHTHTPHTQMIGAKRVIVIDCLKPFLAAIFGLLFLNEPLTVATLIGLLFSTIGVYLVCDSNTHAQEGAEGGDENKEQNEKKKRLKVGYMLAAGECVCV